MYRREEPERMLKEKSPDVYCMQKKAGKPDVFITLMMEKAMTLFEENLQMPEETYPATKQYNTEDPTPQRSDRRIFRTRGKRKNKTKDSFGRIMALALIAQL